MPAASFGAATVPVLCCFQLLMFYRGGHFTVVFTKLVAYVENIPICSHIGLIVPN